MGFVIHWHESAMDLHVFPIPIPPPTSLSTWSLWVFPVHQARALVSCIQPGLVISFTLDNIHVLMLFSWNIAPSPSPTESKSLFYTSVVLTFLYFSPVQSLSCVQLFATPWTAACQASLSITNFWSVPKLMSIESVMPSNHLILCHPLLLLPSIFPSIRVFSNESALHIRWPKYWSFSFSFSFSPSNEHLGLISFRMD